MKKEKIFYFKDKPYRIVSESKIKIWDTHGIIYRWEPVVVYECLYDNTEGTIWVRFYDDFYNNFKLKV